MLNVSPHFHNTAIKFGQKFPERLKEDRDCVPTPLALSEKMLAQIDFKPGMDVLEPHAGTGNIARLLNKIPEINLSIGEYDPGLRHKLEQEGYQVVSIDFFKHRGQYDLIIMNPPYSNNQAIYHLKHAYELLKPGGKIIAVIPEASFLEGTHSGILAAKKDLETTLIDFKSEKLDRETFNNNESKARLKTRIIYIQKPFNDPKAGTAIKNNYSYQITKQKKLTPLRLRATATSKS